MIGLVTNGIKAAFMYAAISLKNVDHHNKIKIHFNTDKIKDHLSEVHVNTDILPKFHVDKDKI